MSDYHKDLVEAGGIDKLLRDIIDYRDRLRAAALDNDEGWAGGDVVLHYYKGRFTVYTGTSECEADRPGEVASGSINSRMDDKEIYEFTAALIDNCEEWV